MGELKVIEDVEADKSTTCSNLKVSEEFPFLIYPYGMNKVFADE